MPDSARFSSLFCHRFVGLLLRFARVRINRKRSYRFFVEHNVPPRYVWLTRQAVWLAAMLVSALAVCIALAGPINLVREIGWLVSSPADRPPLEYLALVFVVPLICYAAGQWASMMLRSAVLAVTVGIGLSLLVIAWLALMVELKVGLVWSVMPIPFVLLLGTWLRASDWIFENTRFGARARAAAIVLVPSAALLIAVPIYRAHEIPLVSPGFDPSASLSMITSNSTVPRNLYQEANRAFVPAKNEDDKHWAMRNEKAIALVTKATRYPGPVFTDPRTSDYPGIDGTQLLHMMLLANGDELQANGKLDEALDRYITALRMDCASFNRERADDEVFGCLAVWASQKGQTAARIHGAITRLNQITTRDLQLEADLQWWYLFARRRLLEGDDWVFYEPQQAARESVKSDLAAAQMMLPTERERAVRMLNILTKMALLRLQCMTVDLARGGQIVEYVTPKWAGFPAADFFSIFFGKIVAGNQTPAKELTDWVGASTDWLATTAPPDLQQMGRRGIDAASNFAWFETWRRATIIQLALQAYRLDHGSLPKSLDGLVGPYLHELPADPYLGFPFRYFPNGMPTANLKWSGQDEEENMRVWKAELADIKPGVAGIWSSGPDLTAEGSETVPDGTKEMKYAFRSMAAWQAENWTVWHRGLWFPIPEQKK